MANKLVFESGAFPVNMSQSACNASRTLAAPSSAIQHKLGVAGATRARERQIDRLRKGGWVQTLAGPVPQQVFAGRAVGGPGDGAGPRFGPVRAQETLLP